MFSLRFATLAISTAMTSNAATAESPLPGLGQLYSFKNQILDMMVSLCLNTIIMIKPDLWWHCSNMFEDVAHD